MALSVNVTGNLSINQGQTTTLTATVTDSNGDEVQGATVEWSASGGQGSFSADSGTTDANGQVSTDWTADFSDTDDVTVTITAEATEFDDNPTVSAPSLTAMDSLGITGQILNMFVNPTGAVSAGANNVVYAEGATGTLASGSDDDVSSDLHIWRVRWDNRSDNNRFLLNNNGAGSMATFFSGNTDQSVYLIFDDGSYVEITDADYHGGSGGFARWTLTDTNAVSKLNALTATGMLLIGVGDAGSIGGVEIDSGTGTAMVTARVVALSIEAIDEQFITIGTEDYELEIDIYGDPDSAEVEGLQEGFYQDWDAANDRIFIRAEEVTRLISGAEWTVVAKKSGESDVTSTILYNVVPATPIFTDPGAQLLFRGAPFALDIEVANQPSIVRAESPLVALKSEPGMTEPEEEDEEPVALLKTAGALPADARLAFTEFDMECYAESGAGDSDNLTVPFTIDERAGFFVEDQMASTSADFEYEVPIGGNTAVTVTVTGLPDGITYSYNDTTKLLTFGGRPTFPSTETVTIQTVNTAGTYSDSFDIETTADNLFLWIASGTSIYKLDATTLQLTSGDDTISISGETLFGSSPIIDIAYGGGNLYVLTQATQNAQRILRINPTSGAVTQRLQPDSYSANISDFFRGIAYEIESGDDAVWIIYATTFGAEERIFKSKPPGTQTNVYITNLDLGTISTGVPAPEEDLRGMDYYDSGVWILNIDNSTVYKVTDNLSNSIVNPGTVESSTVLEDGDSNTLTSLFGMAIGGGFLWAIKSDGTLYKHNISDLSFDSEHDISSTGATAPRAMAYGFE